MRIRTMVILAMVILGTVILATGCGRGKLPAAGGSTLKGVPVKVAKAVSADIVNSVVAGGRVQASADVTLASKIPGKVAEVRVEVGQPVKKGEVLVVFENRELSAQLQQAEAGAAQAVANLTNTEANDKRMESLLAQGAIAQQQYDAARATYLTAEAQVKQSRAALELARTNYDNSFIVAPVDGLVGSKSVQAGAFAGAGVPLVSVVDLDEVFLEVSISESHVNRITPGSAVRIKIPALADKNIFEGKIAAVSPSIDPRSRNFQAKVTLKNPDRVLKSGMYAEVPLETGRRTGVVTIPATALAERDSGKVVYVVEGERVSERRVKLGLSNPDAVEIVQGVSAGEKVVVAGHNLLGDKSLVRVEGGDGK